LIYFTYRVHTKFGDFRFSRSTDMITGVEIENGQKWVMLTYVRSGDHVTITTPFQG